MFRSKAPRIMALLMKDFGFEDFQAAGILGNLGHETAGFRLLQEVRPRSGRGGYGWAQWTGSRRVAFEEFCLRQGLQPSSDEANYGFLRHELTNTSERKAVPAVRATRSLKEAVRVFQEEYERAGVINYKSREAWAGRALEAFLKQGAGH
ncbi:hypothetical protein AA309_05455 [Microvirga vignae]|uniref:Phage tail lysozyme domain-containing protein n=1 Tax=Microvirga vignae TaxID=1225564 RepID=A0A0H1RG14_9HYPH|nr:hypothetical protein AA309_05455 [Microvirga vignae]